MTRPLGEPHPDARRGLFIVVEGGDGAGKTALLRALAQALKADGHQVVLTAEPSTGPTGQNLRALLTDPEAARATSPAEWALLFAADRLHHLRTMVQPARAAGFLVLSSRYTLSSLAYQGPALGIEWVEAVNAHAPAPDLLFFIDTPPEVGLARLAGQREADAFETLERAREAAAGYAQALARIESSGGTVHRLDGTRAVEELVERARALVTRLSLLRRGKGVRVDELLAPRCDHDVQPVPGNEDWGRCVRCTEEGFPLTDRACPVEGCTAGREGA
ncbi:dTMP kinase [Myxococcus sp. Y35]|uniref:dTMP kinase n=1 Tax=Pseudomyxococcus flavus TaxID=3115648 RepID=UPI003CF98857